MEVEQVKKSGGRPPKNGLAAQSSADRSRAYRDRKRRVDGTGRSEADWLGLMLARIIIATSERGVVSREVSNALEKDVDVIKNIKKAFASDFEGVMYRDRILKALNAIVKFKEQTDLEDAIGKKKGFL